MRRIIVVLLMGVVLAVNTGLGFSDTYRELAENPIQIIVDGETVSSYDDEVGIDMPAVIVNGRTMMPLKRTFDLFGVEVSWNGAEKSISASTPNGDVIWLQIDNTSAKIGTLPVVLDAAPTIFEGRTFVPLAFVAEAMGTVVQWDSVTRSVILEIDSEMPAELPEDMQDAYMHTYEEWEQTRYYHNYADSNKSVRISMSEGTAEDELIQTAADIFVETSEFTKYDAIDGYRYGYTDFGGYETYVLVGTLNGVVNKFVFKGFESDEVDSIIEKIGGEQ